MIPGMKVILPLGRKRDLLVKGENGLDMVAKVLELEDLLDI